jgi:DNA invertase Pin-like site-specific DNA recombinase
MAAMAEARRLKCPLMIARLDRLSRDTHFVTGLIKHGKVQIVIAELGLNAEPFTIEIMAAVAAQERRLISRRTKEALAAAKRRGVKLGGDRGARLTAKARAAGNAAQRAGAQARAADLADTVKELQAAGCESLRAIAAELDARGIPAARGGKWSAVQVSRLLARVNPSTVQRISRPFDGASIAVA